MSAAPRTWASTYRGFITRLRCTTRGYAVQRRLASRTEAPATAATMDCKDWCTATFHARPAGKRVVP